MSPGPTGQGKEPPRHISEKFHVAAPYTPKRVTNPHAQAAPHPKSTPFHAPLRTRTTVRRIPPR